MPTKQAPWTPGPWKISPMPYSSNQDFLVDAGKNCVASVDYQHADGQSEANARLIAKAPEAIQCLANFLDMAASWHSVHGHTKDSVHCDAFCDLIPEATRILREAGGL